MTDETEVFQAALNYTRHSDRVIAEHGLYGYPLSPLFDSELQAALDAMSTEELALTRHAAKILAFACEEKQKQRGCSMTREERS